MGIRSSILASTLASASLVLVAAAPAAAEPAPFAPDSVWNLPLRDDAPVSRESDRHVDWLVDQIDRGVPWLNTGQCSMPSIRVDADEPTSEVALAPTSYQDPALLAALSEVPIPADAEVADCSDRNLAIVQRQPDGALKQWELWNAKRGDDGTWTVGWAGVIDDVRTDRGVASPLAWRSDDGSMRSGRNWNVTASSISMTAGVITEDEIERGEVDHALALAVPDAAAGRWVWPAQRTDGGLSDPDAIPEGARLRLDPDLELDGIAMTPMTRMIAEAAQDYGIVVRDKTDGRTTSFYTEELSGDGLSRLRGLLEGRWADHAMREFPWRRLEMLDAPECSSHARECRVDDEAAIDVDTANPRVGEAIVLDTTNSVLNHPRAEVSWDLDGDGRFESPHGIDVKTVFTPTTVGSRTVGVRIVTTEGEIATARRQIEVGPAEEPPSVDPLDPEDPVVDPEDPVEPGGETGSCSEPMCGPRFDLGLDRRGRTLVVRLANLDDERLTMTVTGRLLGHRAEGRRALGVRRAKVPAGAARVFRYRVGGSGAKRKRPGPSAARIRVSAEGESGRVLRTARLRLNGR